MSDFSRVMELALAANQQKTQEAMGGTAEAPPADSAPKETPEPRPSAPQRK